MRNITIDTFVADTDEVTPKVSKGDTPYLKIEAEEGHTVNLWFLDGTLDTVIDALIDLEEQVRDEERP